MPAPEPPPPRPAPPPITLTLPAAAALLGISETLARQLARAGRFPGAFLVGTAWRVHRGVFYEELERRARGLPASTADPDAVLARAQEDVRATRGREVR